MARWGLGVKYPTKVSAMGGHFMFDDDQETPNDLSASFEFNEGGVKKMMVNHPTYIVGCTDEDIRQMVRLGVYMEHSICMFVEGKAHKYGPDKLAHLIEVAGVDHTVLCSDLGLTGSPRPVDGYRAIVQQLLDLQFSEADIRKMISRNAAGLLNLAAPAVDQKVA